MNTECIPALALDLFSILVIFVILLNQKSGRKGVYLPEQKIFIAILRFSLVILVFDIISWALDGADFEGSRILLCLATVVLYVLQAIPAVLYFMYSEILQGEEPSKVKKGALHYFSLCAINAVLSILSPFFGLMFRIEENCTYSRGSLFWLAMLLSYLPLLVVTVKSIFLNRRKELGALHPREVYWPLTIFPLMPMLGGVLQIFLTNLSLIWPFTTLALLIVILFIQSNEMYTDSLTGLYNRRKSDLYLARSILSVSVKKPLSVSIVDVDKFKVINDTFGHVVGDEALRVTASVMRTTCDDEFIGRWGGDEFVIIKFGNARQLAETIERINTELAMYCNQNKTQYRLKLSYGIAQYGKRLDNPDALLSCADKRLYTQKGKTINDGEQPGAFPDIPTEVDF